MNLEKSENMGMPSGWLPEKDVRVEGWLLLGNPLPILIILSVYVYSVKVRKNSELNNIWRDVVILSLIHFVHRACVKMSRPW